MGCRGFRRGAGVAAGRRHGGGRRAGGSRFSALLGDGRKTLVAIEANDGDEKARHPDGGAAVVEASTLVQTPVLEAGASECAGGSDGRRDGTPTPLVSLASRRWMPAHSFLTDARRRHATLGHADRVALGATVSAPRQPQRRKPHRPS